jgi:dTDP-4-dehydrorhamnose reductase
MKILITGSNGLLGQKLVGHLENLPEFHCIASSKGERRFPINGPNIQYESLDILDSTEVNHIFKKHKPVAVINTAAMTQADHCERNKGLAYQINVGAVKNMAEYCNYHRIHFIQLSTDFVFDGTSGPYDEEDKPNPVNYYGETKFLAEQAVLNMDCPATVIRTILVYGFTPNMSRSNFFQWVVKNLEKKIPLRIVTDQIRNPTLVEDLVMGCMQVLKKKKYGIYHIGGKDTLSPYQFACRISDFYGFDTSLITPVGADNFEEIAQRPLVTGLKIEKAINELNYQPHSFEKSMAMVSQQLSGNQLQ